MTSDQLYGRLEAAVVGTPITRKWRPGILLEYAMSVIESILEGVNLDELTDEQKQMIVDTIKRWYDDFVRPIDLPYIPNLYVEDKVDDAIWYLIKNGTERLLGMV